jgi:hypothetical protein
MTTPADLQQIAQNLFFWQSYDPQLKTDLCSCALTTRRGSFLIDPIPLTDQALDQLQETGAVTGVVVTNGNHLRASAQFSALFSVPIYSRRESLADGRSPDFTLVEDGTKICDTLAVIAIEGAAPGEIVLHSYEHRGAVIVGDALINFEPYGFAFLPRKYCSNYKEMRRSLRKVSACQFDKILFAHGTPILSQGAARLQQLLDPAV